MGGNVHRPHRPYCSRRSRLRLLLLGCAVRRVLGVSRLLRARCRWLCCRRALRHLLPRPFVPLDRSPLTASLFEIRRNPLRAFPSLLLKIKVERLREFESISVTHRQYAALTVV